MSESVKIIFSKFFFIYMHTIIRIFVVITTFRQLCSLAFIRCLSIWITLWEFQTDLWGWGCRWFLSNIAQLLLSPCFLLSPSFPFHLCGFSLQCSLYMQWLLSKKKYGWENKNWSLTRFDLSFHPLGSPSNMDDTLPNWLRPINR